MEKITVNYYLTSDGKSPFEDWLKSLKDVQGRSIIRARLRRLMLGNLGAYQWVGDGVYELKIFFGPGYRLYFGRDGNTLIVLLCGGDKSSQQKDIEKSRRFWVDYWRVK